MWGGEIVRGRFLFGPILFVFLTAGALYAHPLTTEGNWWRYEPLVSDDEKELFVRVIGTGPSASTLGVFLGGSHRLNLDVSVSPHGVFLQEVRFIDDDRFVLWSPELPVLSPSFHGTQRSLCVMFDNGVVDRAWGFYTLRLGGVRHATIGSVPGVPAELFEWEGKCDDQTWFLRMWNIVGVGVGRMELSLYEKDSLYGYKVWELVDYGVSSLEVTRKLLSQ